MLLAGRWVAILYQASLQIINKSYISVILLKKVTTWVGKIYVDFHCDHLLKSRYCEMDANFWLFFSMNDEIFVFKRQDVVINLYLQRNIKKALLSHNKWLAYILNINNSYYSKLFGCFFMLTARILPVIVFALTQPWETGKPKWMIRRHTFCFMMTYPTPPKYM